MREAEIAPALHEFESLPDFQISEGSFIAMFDWYSSEVVYCIPRKLCVSTWRRMIVESVNFGRQSHPLSKDTLYGVQLP